MTLGRSKGQISLNFSYKVNFKDFFYKTLCVFSQIKYRKHIEQNFHSVTWGIPPGRDLEVLGVKNFSFGICDGAPSTVHSSFIFCFDMKKWPWYRILLKHIRAVF